ncbi:MAG: sugar transferase [Sphingomonadaceae bacterium]|nr:sugar transferase [Sphingomonadaceae bacterium]
MNNINALRSVKSRVSVTPRRWLETLRFQLGATVVLAVLLPAAISQLINDNDFIALPSDRNAFLGTLVASFGGIYLFRRVIAFPGIRAFSYVFPAFGITYAIVLTIFFFGRLEYSRLYYATSYLICSAIFFVICTISQRSRLRLYTVPGGDIGLILQIPGIECHPLRVPIIPNDPVKPAIVVDLRADLDAEWQRFIAEAAIAGCAVYHVKQVRESLTGQVEIEHLSENSFGSLLPNLAYRKIKRLIDVLAALIALPLLALPMTIAAIFVKIGSPGPIFFRQQRMGYRGRPFSVFKFRTMHDQAHTPFVDDRRAAAMTLEGDVRVTSIGRALRRWRIDELPQILNVLRGEMSWIGPRPEALELSRWYESEIPFYVYRHIIRPGITGWAQVNQGHVAELTEVHQKLHYDFYYVKNFSGWLDWLIVFRTLGIVLNGFGAR